MTKGAGFSLVAVIGLNKSANTHCPFSVGNFISTILVSPKEVCTCDEKKLKTKTRKITIKRFFSFILKQILFSMFLPFRFHKDKLQFNLK